MKESDADEKAPTADNLLQECLDPADLVEHVNRYPLPPPLPAPSQTQAVQKRGFQTARPNFESVRLHFAINKPNSDDLKRLLSDGMDVDFRIHGNTPLILSILRHNLDTAYRLLEAGADVNLAEKTPMGRQPLHLAAQQGDVSLMRRLMQFGASVHAADARLLTPLHWAALCGHLSAVCCVIKAGAHLNVRDADGRTPLCRAVGNSHYEVVCYLVEQGAEVNISDCRASWSALVLAVVRGDLLMVWHLLKLGADMEQRDRHQQTALHAAAARLRSDNLDILASTDINEYTHVVQLMTPSVKYARQSYHGLSILQLLLDFGADVHVTDALGVSPLRLAAIYGNLISVYKLIEAGANLQRETWLQSWMEVTALKNEQLDYLKLKTEVKVASLTVLCKFCIRRSLTPGVWSKIDKLPLPDTMKSFLQLHRMFTEDGQLYWSYTNVLLC